MRTLIVLAALLVTGLGLARLTAPMAPPADVVEEPATTPDGGKIPEIHYELVLSAEAESISLGGCMGAIREGKTMGPVTGVFTASGDDARTVLVNIRWADQSPGHRFAKLRLEIPGKPTLEHVFDAPGDIDDVWLQP